MTESMPSRVQPAHAAQKPVICERLSLVRVAAPEYGTAISDMVLPPHRVHTPGRKQFVGQHTTTGRTQSARQPDLRLLAVLKQGANGRLRYFAHGISRQSV